MTRCWPCSGSCSRPIPGPEIVGGHLSGRPGPQPQDQHLRQLMARARYDLLVIADGDVKVGPDYLARVAAAFRQPGVGLVSCPYRAGPSHTLGAAWRP